MGLGIWNCDQSSVHIVVPESNREIVSEWGFCRWGVGESSCSLSHLHRNIYSPILIERNARVFCSYLNRGFAQPQCCAIHKDIVLSIEQCKYPVICTLSQGFVCSQDETGTSNSGRCTDIFEYQGNTDIVQIRCRSRNVVGELSQSSTNSSSHYSRICGHPVVGCVGRVEGHFNFVVRQHPEDVGVKADVVDSVAHFHYLY